MVVVTALYDQHWHSVESTISVFFEDQAFCSKIGAEDSRRDLVKRYALMLCSSVKQYIGPELTEFTPTSVASVFVWISLVVLASSTSIVGIGIHDLYLFSKSLDESTSDFGQFLDTSWLTINHLVPLFHMVPDFVVVYTKFKYMYDSVVMFNRLSMVFEKCIFKIDSIQGSYHESDRNHDHSLEWLFFLCLLTTSTPDSQPSFRIWLALLVHFCSRLFWKCEASRIPMEQLLLHHVSVLENIPEKELVALYIKHTDPFVLLLEEFCQVCLNRPFKNVLEAFRHCNQDRKQELSSTMSAIYEQYVCQFPLVNYDARCSHEIAHAETVKNVVDVSHLSEWKDFLQHKVQLSADDVLLFQAFLQKLTALYSEFYECYFSDSVECVSQVFAAHKSYILHLLHSDLECSVPTEKTKGWLGNLSFHRSTLAILSFLFAPSASKFDILIKFREIFTVSWFDVVISLELMVRYLYECNDVNREAFSQSLAQLEAFIMNNLIWKDDEFYSKLEKVEDLGSTSRNALWTLCNPLQFYEPVTPDFISPVEFQMSFFFRRLYRHASRLLLRLALLLSLDIDTRRKIWNLFVHMFDIELNEKLFKGKHLSVLLCCLIYSVCKILDKDISFKKILAAFKKGQQEIQVEKHFVEDYEEIFHNVPSSTDGEIINLVDYYNREFLVTMKAAVLSFLHPPSDESNSMLLSYTTCSTSSAPTGNDEVPKVPQHGYGTRSKRKLDHSNDVVNVVESPRPITIQSVPWPYPRSFYKYPMTPRLTLSIRDSVASLPPSLLDHSASERSTSVSPRLPSYSPKRRPTTLRYTFPDFLS